MIAGYECADHINRSGERINLQSITQHDVRVREDYLDLQGLGIKTVREGICWSFVETKPFVFDFSRLDSFFKASEELGIQIIWDLCHFGYPDDLTPTHPQFVKRFCALCEAFLNYHKNHCNKPPWIVPINEISFLSWHSGDVRGTVPFAVNSGADIKYHLCKAAIQGIKIIKEIAPNSIVLLVEPLIKIHKEYRSLSIEEVEKKNDGQFEAMEIILGMRHPELSGNAELVDMLGFNYYYNNQWNEMNETIDWLRDAQRMTPLNVLLQEVFYKYRKPIILTETGHFGPHRDLWMRQITEQCLLTLKAGVDLKGVCIYPVIDRPDWDDLSSYCNCGIWDLDNEFNRIVFNSYYSQVRESGKIFQNELFTID